MKKFVRGFRVFLVVCAVSGIAVLPAAAQDKDASKEAASKTVDATLANANNPLADMVAFNIQNYYVSSIYGTDETANTAWLRYIQPFGKWLMRASLPINTVPVGNSQDPVSGLGDFNAFVAYLISDAASPKQYGVGPLLVAPTATDDALGADVWQAGAAAVYFDATSKVVQWGGLLTYQTDFAGDGSDTSIGAVQPFLFVQLGKGTYMGSAPLWVFDFENSTYNVPFGIRLGKVVKAGNTVFNMFIEPQFTMLHDGVGQPETQIFSGINMQFLGD